MHSARTGQPLRVCVQRVDVYKPGLGRLLEAVVTTAPISGALTV